MSGFQNFYNILQVKLFVFLNQERAWFLRIVSVWASVFVCPPLRLLITSDVIWTPYD